LPHYSTASEKKNREKASCYDAIIHKMCFKWKVFVIYFGGAIASIPESLLVPANGLLFCILYEKAEHQS
jgi:hypothetical protein